MICPRCGDTRQNILGASLRRFYGLLVQKAALKCKSCGKGFTVRTVATTKTELAKNGVTIH